HFVCYDKHCGRHVEAEHPKGAAATHPLTRNSTQSTSTSVQTTRRHQASLGIKHSKNLGNLWEIQNFAKITAARLADPITPTLSWNRGMDDDLQLETTDC